MTTRDLIQIPIRYGAESEVIALETDFSKAFRPTSTGRRFASLLLRLDVEKQVGLQGKRILDVGSGSGLLGIVAAKRGALVTCSDIRGESIPEIQHNASINSVVVDARQADGLVGLDGKFDLILCNPPSVPSEEDVHGRALVDHLLSTASRYLLKGGVLLLYHASILDWNLTKKAAADWKCYRVIQKFTVCLNRPEFWETYRKFDLNALEQEGLVRRRGELVAVVGRFVLAWP